MGVYNKNYDLLSPVLKVAMTVLDAEKEWARSHGNEAGDWKGLSFTEIRERLSFDKSMDYFNVSRAQDILLDEGVLFPETELKECLLNGGKVAFWTRTYKTVSGEYVRTLLENIYGSIQCTNE